MILIFQLSRLNIEDCLRDAILYCKCTPPSLIHPFELIDFTNMNINVRIILHWII